MSTPEVTLVTLNKFFMKATQDVKKLTIDNSNTLLKLYAYFKQANFGDNNTDKPPFFDFRNGAKWNAWKELNGTSTTKAKIEYIKLVQQQLEASV